MGKWSVMKKKVAWIIAVFVVMAFFGYRCNQITHYDELMMKNGFELRDKIKAFYRENHRLPETLEEIGLTTDFECNYFKGGFYFYQPFSDSTFSLEYMIDAENNRGLYSESDHWTERYSISTDGFEEY